MESPRDPAGFDLRRERFDRGLTLQALAEALGVSRRTLIRIEQGDLPSPRVAKAIADWHGAKPSELWPDHAAASNQEPEHSGTSSEKAAA
jgi:transcriptional regulator with XRE-family HTH domain